ncbi:MAG: hydrogenase nickel incorporation protein HypB [Defluviitaleaceae bacterium]|nr:hydrogenase nickel incorporation protein HypB [Defluviitaleaceae bacterium]
MSEFRTITLQKGILEKNDEVARVTRAGLDAKGIKMLNLMGSPGCGKTTFLVGTINALKADFDISVMEADVDSDVDAATVAAATGVPVVQLHSGGMCHLDAEMTRQGIENLGATNGLVILENIGNLLCTANYDVGAHFDVMILSVPEGDDKPLKYPPMFKKVDALIITKMDAMPVFDFDMQKCEERVRKLNPNVQIFPVSAKTGEGMDAWTDWLRNKL